MKDIRKVGIGMIINSLETAQQVASRMKYASIATELAISTTINKDEKTTLTVNYNAQNINKEAIQLVKMFNEAFQITIQNIQSVAEEFESTDKALGNQIEQMYSLVEMSRNFDTYRKAKNG
jgi:type VII secretion effector (TIGR04197 family)